MQEAKEEVRARLNIEDVIGEYVQLKRAGRNFKGLSPFTSEKTPSFVVSPDKHIWHDFSSNKGGDVFGFVMEVEGMDFRQALEHLARKAGVDLSQYESKGSGELAKKKRRLQSANELAAHYYQHSLLRNQHALEYVFKNRQLSKQTVGDFRIGYAPSDGKALQQFLQRKGYKNYEIAEAGLANRFGGDLFRSRMMVPLMDGSGQVIGFTARVIEDDPKAPKYLNTPQTLLYDKSRHVFGLSQAKEAIRTSGYAVVVEGNMDVVSSHQAGVANVVATAGTAMTEWHLRALKRLAGQVRLAFDGDKAGLAATERAIPIASHVGVELRIVSLPDGAKDPDELIQKGVTLWQEAIEASQPALDWLLSQYEASHDLTSAQGKRVFTSMSLAVVRQLQDPIEIEHYERKIAEMTNSSLEAVRAKAQSDTAGQEQVVKKQTKVVKQKPASPDVLAFQDSVLALGLLDTAARAHFSGFDSSQFIGQERQAVAEYLGREQAAPLNETPLELQKYDTYVKILLLKAENRYVTWTEQDRSSETARLLRQVANEHKKQTQDQLTEQLRHAENDGDDEKAAQLRSQLNTLIKEIARGKR